MRRPFILILLAAASINLIGPLAIQAAAPIGPPPTPQPTIGIGISPMIIDMTLTAQQQRITQQIEIDSSSPQQYLINSVATDLVQREDGTVLPANAGTHPTSCAPWLQFDQSATLLPAHGHLDLAVTITRPSHITGTHLCGLQIVAVPEDPIQSVPKSNEPIRPGFVHLSFTYTVVIKVTLPGSTPAPKLAFERVALTGDPPYPTVDVLVRNVSQTGVSLSINAELRPRDAGQTIRVPLLIQRGHDRVPTHTLWPEGLAHATGRVPMPVPPGSYALTVRATAQRHVIPYSTHVTVPMNDSAELAWEDPITPVVLKSHQHRTVMFSLYNLTDLTLSPVLTMTPTHQNLCQGWIVDLAPTKGPIPPHGYRRVQAIITAAAHEPSTCVLAVTAQDDKNRVTTHLIASTPPGTSQPVVTVQSPVYRPDTNELTVTIANQSELPATFSSWTLFLTSGERRLPVGRWIHSDPRPVVPHLPSSWTIPLQSPLAPGVYTVRMMGFWKERTILFGEQDLLVSGEDSTVSPPRSSR